MNSCNLKSSMITHNACGDKHIHIKEYLNERVSVNDAVVRKLHCFTSLGFPMFSDLYVEFNTTRIVSLNSTVRCAHPSLFFQAG